MLRRHLIAIPDTRLRLVDEAPRVEVGGYAVQSLPSGDFVRDAEVVSVFAGGDGCVLEDFGDE